jgi:hypothetical protein
MISCQSFNYLIIISVKIIRQITKIIYVYHNRVLNILNIYKNKIQRINNLFKS